MGLGKSILPGCTSPIDLFGGTATIVASVDFLWNATDEYHNNEGATASGSITLNQLSYADFAAAGGFPDYNQFIAFQDGCCASAPTLSEGETSNTGTYTDFFGTRCSFTAGYINISPQVYYETTGPNAGKITVSCVMTPYQDIPGTAGGACLGGFYCDQEYIESYGHTLEEVMAGITMTIDFPIAGCNPIFGGFTSISGHFTATVTLNV